ncbi:GSCOCT00014000001.2-RA-CDS [Cotesia congregata]|uniref:Venom protein 90-3 n=1 Tax=Cotesia congregata TaxID=51543 RepID=A0A8J2H727_COTCN|nr:GSCOCT00014000001.2-RA-CDS [Cotesia congregata]CAG5078950.1 Venom protein 90-3 [Cotesia congregata]
MITYGIISLVVGSLLLVGSTGQTNEEDDMIKFEEYHTSTKYSVEHLYQFADEVFGVDRWSNDIHQTCETKKIDQKKALIFAACRSTVKVSLPSGIYHVGIGSDSGIFSPKDKGLIEFEKRSLELGVYNALMSFDNVKNSILNAEHGTFKTLRMLNNEKQEKKEKKEVNTSGKLWDVMTKKVDEDENLKEDSRDDGEFTKNDEGDLSKVRIE